MKLKIAGLFRSLIGQGGNVEPTQPVAAAQPPVAPIPPVPSLSASHADYASPQSGSSYVSQNSEQIGIPLGPIINSLPLDLKAKLVAAPSAGAMIFLQTEVIISQLAFGAVKITFGELRQLAPGVFVNANSVYDSRPLNLPLSEILARINPTLLARRPAAQKFEVAEDIAGPFGGNGRGVSFSTNPVKSAAPATPPPRETKPVMPVNFNPPPPAPTPLATPPPTYMPRQVTPAVAPTPAPKSEPIAFSPRQSAPMTPPVPFAEPSKPASNGYESPVMPVFKFTAAPVPPLAAPMPAAEAPPTIFIPLKDLAENWPNEIKDEIVQNGLANASVPLPIAMIEPGLKRGRVTISWKNLRALIQPVVSAWPGDALDLDLPLKVLAPVFLQAKKNLTPAQSRVAVSAEIPNLFFGFPQPEPVAPPVFQPAPLPMSRNPGTETSIPFTQNPPNPNPAKVVDTNLFSLAAKNAASNGAAVSESEFFKRTPAPATDFLSRQLQPKDVVTKALALPGVAGAIVALADGLRVAGEVPPEFNVETMAAFLPQIFERVSQCSRELRMGTLNNVGFTVGNVPWKIFRVNSVYFAAFGRAGETLPKPQLAALAAGLDHKQK